MRPVLAGLASVLLAATSVAAAQDATTASENTVSESAASESTASESTASETTAADGDFRKFVFGVALTISRLTLKAGDGNEIVGNAAQANLGGGYIDRRWFLTGSVDILLGPYEPTRGKQLNVDYYGTGISTWWGYSAQTLDLRNADGGYGFVMGLNYADIVGRSSGRNRREGALDEDLVLLDNYIMRVNTLTVTPGIFFSWLAPGRPEGNTPDLLMTRLEGYLLTLGVSIPLATSYSAKFDTRSRESQTLKSTEEEAREESPNSETIRQGGNLRGYGILIGFTAFLGT